MTLQQLKYVTAVAETGTISGAAQALFLSQPSLTAAIHDLEQELNITIFSRTNRGVALTPAGDEFLGYVRQVLEQTDLIEERYTGSAPRRHRFSVSTQHYSFAVKAVVEMVKQFNTAEYEFAIRETRTRTVIEDVSTLRSEIGILYLSDFNRRAITKLLKTNELEFHKLIDCRVYAYLWKGHPLAKEKAVRLEQLYAYPCLSFEQGGNSSFYFAEEVFTTNEYPRTIKANDRATMLNLMVGLNGYTLCSGIICEELNGDDYIAVPLADEACGDSEQMEIGYIVKKHQTMSKMGVLYIQKAQEYLAACAKTE